VPHPDTVRSAADAGSNVFPKSQLWAQSTFPEQVAAAGIQDSEEVSQHPGDSCHHSSRARHSLKFDRPIPYSRCVKQIPALHGHACFVQNQDVRVQMYQKQVPVCT
jgi:hypothetical protein